MQVEIKMVGTHIHQDLIKIRETIAANLEKKTTYSHLTAEKENVLYSYFPVILRFCNGFPLIS